MRYHQAIVVGGGLAGLRAAIELSRRNIDVAILSKVHPMRSHSIAAQGGINAALGNNPEGRLDNWERHAFDTVKGGDYLGDQDAVVRLCQEGPARVCEAEHWGCFFSRTEEGKIAQRPFGGAGFPRTAYAADRTGHALLNTLYEKAAEERQKGKQKIVFYDEWLVTVLVTRDNICHGLIALDIKTGKLEAFKTEAVIFCTGGAGRIYANSTNALINTGMGIAVPYRAGVPLKDMEFIQFHPTTLYGTNILISEGARGEGGTLLNNKGDRFLANYDDSRTDMEMAPRDIVARNMVREIKKGNGFEDAYLLLDLRQLGEKKIKERLPGIRELSIKFAGIDPVEKPIPVHPGQHYTMGGIDTNIDTEAVVKGFYAAGEAACVNVHGANRLGGNSLLETLVFGKITGIKASEYIAGNDTNPGSGQILTENLRQQEEKIERLLLSSGRERHSSLCEELKKVMMEKVGIFREEKTLREAIDKVRELKERYKAIGNISCSRRFNYDLYWAMELGGSLDVAEIVVVGALERKESRGSHYRTDYIKRDDAQWLRHTIATYTSDGPRLNYADVRLGYFKPEERRY